MKKFSKKLLSVFMAGAILFSAAPAVNAAESSVDAAKSFTDVAENVWYSRAVDYVSEMEIMTGTQEETFSPRENLSRAMFVTILYRFAETPEVTEESSFSDVPEDSFYKNAVDWAVSEGIVFGTSDTTFSPNRSITRQEMACMVARYVGEDLPEDPDAPDSFADQTSVSAYAKEAVEAMRKTGLFAGKEGRNFCPQATSTRAETATVCMRLGLKLGKIPSAATLTFYEKGNEPKAVTLSEEDTARLFLLLNDPSWSHADFYAEFVPTHTLTFWCGEYRFELGVENSPTQPYDDVNYVSGDYCGLISSPEGEFLPEILHIFESYAD